MRSRRATTNRPVRITMILMAVVLALLIVANLNLHRADANADAALYKYYTSYRIMPGDTLWSIAEEHRDASVESAASYIDEVRRINGLSGDVIVAGQTICIPYYTGTYK